MDLKQVFHMNHGSGEDSYAQNSGVQNDILLATKPYTEQALMDYLNTQALRGRRLGMADIGCGSGPNALAAVSHMLEAVYATWQQQGRRPQEVVVYLNDLPMNDFNHVFVSLPGLLAQAREKLSLRSGPCFVFGAPGTFHGRLFPRRSLHFAHSSSSLHWISQAPTGLNKGKINISKTSPKEIVDGYTKQFGSDFSMFLKSRSKEMVGGGRMVLSFMARRTIEPTEDEDSYLQWELIAHSLMSMVSQKLVEEEKVDSFHTPYYAAHPEEVVKLVEDEGSFEVDRLDPFEISWDGIHGPKTKLGKDDNPKKSSGTVEGSEKLPRGETIAKMHRAVVEPLMEYHFGNSIMDELFFRYGKTLDAHLSVKEPKFVNLIVTLVKKKLTSSTFSDLVYATILKSCH